MRVLVIGDSMVKYLQNYLPSQLSDYDVHVKSFSGIKIEQLSREILKLNCQYDYFVIHVGTNNWRDDIDLYKKKYDNLFREVLRFNPHCKVIVSPLIMRNTNLHLSFQEQVANSILVKSINKHFTIINSELAKLCEATGFCFCRSQSWIGYICRDGVHLNYAGNRRLANFFVQHIRKVINKVICVSSVPNILSPKDFPSLTPLCAVQFPSVFPQRISLHSPNGTSSYKSSWLPRDDEPAVPAHDCESSLQAHNCKPPPLPTCDSGPSLQICGHGFPVPTPDFPEPAFNSLGKTCDCRSPSPTPCGLSKKACDHEFSGKVHKLSRKDHGLSGKAYDYELRRKANDYGSSGKAYDRELSRKATDRGLSEKTGNHGWSKNTPAHKLSGKIDDQQSFRKAQNYGLPKKMNDHKLPENLYGHKSLLQSSDWKNFHRTKTSRRSLLQTTSFPSPEIPYVSNVLFDNSFTCFISVNPFSILTDENFSSESMFNGGGRGSVYPKTCVCSVVLNNKFQAYKHKKTCNVNLSEIVLPVNVLPDAPNQSNQIKNPNRNCIPYPTNIESSNVVLNDNFQQKLDDFKFNTFIDNPECRTNVSNCLSSSENNTSAVFTDFKIHKTSKEIPSNFVCIFKNCGRKFRYAKTFSDHLNKNHKHVQVVKKNQFKCMGEFQAWLEEESTKTFSFFAKITGTKQVKNKKFHYYACQFFVRNRCRISKSGKRNSKGTLPHNLYCPARISVWETTNKVTSTFYYGHNHPLIFKNTKFHPLKPSTRNFIKANLDMGVRIKKIQDYLRDDSADRHNRDGFPVKEHFITCKTIQNYARNLELNSHCDPDDAKSVKCMVDELMIESFNPILIYKPQNMNTEFGPKGLDKLADNKTLFALGLQTKEQKIMMVEGSKRILCMDATYNSNRYGFYLFNMVVPDEFGRGYPVAHFIVNRLNTETLTVLFESLKLRLPGLYINCIMTDDDQATKNAFSIVFGQHIRQLLCKWHIHRSWLRQLRSKISDFALRQKIYHMLVVLLEEKQESKFTNMTNKFIDDYSENVPLFIQYFLDTYYERAEMWAMAYRNFPHAHSDTNMYCESFHSKLKTCYLNRKVNIRIDSLVCLLLQMEKDTHSIHRSNVLYEVPHSIYPPTYLRRHKAGLKICDSDVTKINNNLFLVKSQTNPQIVYKVHRKKDGCQEPDFCYWKCLQLSCLGLCSHLYYCTCSDSSRCCKHVHKIHSLTVRISIPYDISPSILPSQVVSLSDEKLFDKPNTDLEFKKNCPQNIIKQCTSLMSELSELLQNKTIPNSLLTSFHKSLKTMVSQCKGVDSKPVIKNIPKMDYTPLAPNQKLNKVPKFCKTLAKKQYSKSLQYPDFADKVAIEKSLLSEENADDPCFIQLPVLESNQNDNILPKESSFTPSLNYVKDITSPLLTISGKAISLLALKSLDPFIPNNEVVLLREKSGCFQTGWLYDCIIDAFCDKIIQNFNCLYVDCILSSYLLSNPQYSYSLFNDKDLSTIDKIFIPININNMHWILMVIKLKNKNIEIYDPASTNFTTKLNPNIVFWNNFLKRRLGSESNFRVIFPSHVCQNDSSSCGVFVCYYVYRLLHNLEVNKPFNVIQLRKDIFNVIAGSCLNNKVYEKCQDHSEINFCSICCQIHC